MRAEPLRRLLESHSHRPWFGPGGWYNCLVLLDASWEEINVERQRRREDAEREAIADAVKKKAPFCDVRFETCIGTRTHMLTRYCRTCDMCLSTHPEFVCARTTRLTTSMPRGSGCGSFGRRRKPRLTRPGRVRRRRS